MKAGGFPYWIDDDLTFVCLFVSNDPEYGGAAPQVAKGHLDGVEFPIEGARREIEEETGVVVTEGWKVGEYEFAGQITDYTLHVFAFPVEFQTPVAGDEGTGVWIELNQALEMIRPAQREMLEDFALQRRRHMA